MHTFDLNRRKEKFANILQNSPVDWQNYDISKKCPTAAKVEERIHVKICKIKKTII
jgi:hypothetical protein